MTGAARPVGEVARLFLRLGVTAFGGPAAHVALVHAEVVARRRWLHEQHFVDLVGLTSLLPGPNSTELVIAVGRERAGWRGLVAAGVAFVLPAALLVGAIAWAYERHGHLPAADDLRAGVLPVVLAVLLVALWRLRRTAAASGPTAAVAVAATAAALAGAHELVVLAAGGAAVGLWRNRHRLRPATAAVVPLPLVLAGPGDPGPVRLFLLFAKIGSLLFGSGYVLLAFLEGELVDRGGYLTDQQVLDTIAAGQVTPGPLFTSATMAGYLVGGAPGAVAATVGIFLPSFVLVAALAPLLGRLLRSPAARPVLDGLDAAALGLMAAAVADLGADAADGPAGIAVAIASVAVLAATGVNPTWLVLAAGAGGVAVGAVA